MEAFDFARLLARVSQSDSEYLEFLRHPSLSVGLYILAAGAVDTQEPHSEDEVYYIVRGSASITVGDESRAVAPGSLIFVPAQVEHRFHSISENLQILVFFAPAEYTQAPSHSPAQ
jgi:mannose-6-phosphate isomerase-like protein (cupin superfamily)